MKTWQPPAVTVGDKIRAALKTPEVAERYKQLKNLLYLSKQEGSELTIYRIWTGEVLVRLHLPDRTHPIELSLPPLVPSKL